MNGPMRRVALTLFLAFLALVLDITYWQIISADRLREHPQNPRVIITRSGRARGQIISADTTMLARSVPDPSDPRYFIREYPHESLYAHTVGFSSRLFGDSGLEASHATVLTSGRDLTVSGIIGTLLGEDLWARSIQLTMNHRLQQTAARALGDRRGAVVAIEPASGQVLAMVSSPAFDPNSLIGNEAAPAWEALGENNSRPLENRATGRSLPGELLPADLLAALDPDPGSDPGTAFEIALRTAARANGGLLMKPYIVARVFDGDSNLEAETEPVLLDRWFSDASLQESMDHVVIDSARFGEIRGTGEAGASQSSGGGRLVWFAGFLPVDQPAIAVAVVIESMGPVAESDTGTAEVASIGRAVMTGWLNLQ